MSRRTDELLALRDLAKIVHGLLDGTHDVAAVREAVLLCDAFRPREYQPRNPICADGGEGGGCVDFDLALPGTSPEEQILKSKSKPAIFPNIFPNRGTWLSPFASAWVTRFGKGCAVPWGVLARALRNLVTEQGEAEVLRRWKNYLASTTPQYVSPPRFAFTFGSWDRPQPRKLAPGEIPDQLPDEDDDAYAMRLARLGY